MMDKIELLNKIKALADNGVGGEKQNATKLLADLMQKYNIGENELQTEVLHDFEFKFSGVYAKELAHQVLYSIIGNLDNSKGFFIAVTYGGKKKNIIRCTNAEFIEFQAKYKFYKYHFLKDLDIFYDAFVEKNDIYPPDDKCKKDDNRTMTDDDIKAVLLSRGLDRHQYNLQIEQKGENQ